MTCLAAKLRGGGSSHTFVWLQLNSFKLSATDLQNNMITFILPVWTTPSGEGSPSPDHMEEDEGHPDEAFWLVTSTEFPQRRLLGLKRACHSV